MDSSIMLPHPVSSFKECEQHNFNNAITPISNFKDCEQHNRKSAKKFYSRDLPVLLYEVVEEERYLNLCKFKSRATPRPSPKRSQFLAYLFIALNI